MKIELKRTDAMRLLLACTHAGNSANDENSVNLWQRIHDEIKRQIDESESDSEPAEPAEQSEGAEIRQYEADAIALEIYRLAEIASIFSEWTWNTAATQKNMNRAHEAFTELSHRLAEIYETADELAEGLNK